MRDQLLWIDALARLAIGGPLLLFPQTFIKMLGLPAAGNPFWPRLTGALLVALAAALFIEARFAGSRGLSLGGAFAVNVATAFMLATSLSVGGMGLPLRGRIAMWTAVGLLVLLSLVELAHA
jgi:hypothetical protein